MTPHSQKPHADDSDVCVQCAIITVSDTRTAETDKSGQLMQSLLTASGHRIVHYQIVKDEPAQIAALVTHLSSSDTTQAILLNGGTGIAPRDTTYDAIVPLLTKTLPGFGEMFRQLSYAEIGSRAIASRAVGGIRTELQEGRTKHTLLFSVPGSRKAVELALKSLILPELIHLTQLLNAS